MNDSAVTGADHDQTGLDGDGERYPWLKNYPKGVTWDRHFTPRSLPDLLDSAAREHRQRVCTSFLGASLTYGQIAKLSDCFAKGLQAEGFGHGDRIGLFLPNTPYYVAAYFGILKTGATVVNFNPLYTEEEVAHQAKDAGVSAMVTLDLALLFDKLAALAAKGSIDRIVVCPFAAILPPVKSFLFKFLKRKELADVRSAGSRIRSWGNLIANDGRFQPVSIDPERDVALLQYTGGTTGTPKGAMLSHANLTINVEQMVAWNPDAKIGGERIMGVLPFFHVFAMTSVMNYGIRIGAELILVPRFDLKQTVELIKRHRATILPGVPTLYTALLNFPAITRDDLSSLKYCVSGGAPLPFEIRRRFEEFTGGKLVEGYGLSETSPVATCNPINGLVKQNTIGQPLPATVISIRAPEEPTKEMLRGEAGEVCIKGPQVMSGYWNKPEENAASFVDGYFRTGDIGYLDEDGFVFLIDRIKDIINCSGFKVYPRRIEEAIYAHPAVAEVTVIGVPDEYRGEAPKAFVKLKPGATATEADIFALLKVKISKIEMPASIEFRDELPRTMVGKLSKKELRQPASG